jgi:hypothetical protein
LLHDVKFKSTDNQLGVNEFFFMVSAQTMRQGGHKKGFTNLRFLASKTQ